MAISGCDANTAPVTLTFNTPESNRIRQISAFTEVYVEVSINGSVPQRVSPQDTESGTLGPYDLLINQPNEISIYWLDKYPDPTNSSERITLYLGREDATIELEPDRNDYDIYASSTFTATGLADEDVIDSPDDGNVRTRIFGGICNAPTQSQLQCGRNECSADYDGDGISNLEEILSAAGSNPLDANSPVICGDVRPIESIVGVNENFLNTH